MNLHTLIATKNDCYKAGAKITPKGIMPHSTGANNPTLKRYVGPDDGKLGVNKNNNHWNNSGISVCVHAFIGKMENGEVATYQILPWDHRGWHGGGSSNNTHISFEICEDGLNDAVYFGKVYQEAVELCVYLCREYNLTEKDILCHCEGHKKGIASNHADVMHWFPKFGKSMDTFRADVAKLLASGGGEQVESPTTQPSTASSSIAVGDVVQFSGNTHYVSANATEGKPCGEGGAKVTQYSQGAKHPYHIIGDKSPCNAYGWVDADTLTKA
ncbi:MAG: peptidoglycan recognition family protein [Eubacteriales bacterium]